MSKLFETNEYVFREMLFRLRKYKLGFTRKELAKKYGFSWYRIKAIENGAMNIHAPMFRDYVERIVNDARAIDEDLVPSDLLDYLKYCK